MRSIVENVQALKLRYQRAAHDCRKQACWYTDILEDIIKLEVFIKKEFENSSCSELEAASSSKVVTDEYSISA